MTKVNLCSLGRLASVAFIWTCPVRDMALSNRELMMVIVIGLVFSSAFVFVFHGPPRCIGDNFMIPAAFVAGGIGYFIGLDGPTSSMQSLEDIPGFVDLGLRFFLGAWIAILYAVPIAWVGTLVAKIVKHWMAREFLWVGYLQCVLE